MSELMICSRCGGFMTPTAAACPHCDARPPRLRRSRLRRLLGLAGSASLGLTMMACYGGPPCEPGSPGCADPQAANKTTSPAPAPVAVAATPTETGKPVR